MADEQHTEAIGRRNALMRDDLARNGRHKGDHKRDIEYFNEKVPEKRAQVPKAPKRQPLRPQDISYLALEGGGGKGFAFLGALQVLEESSPNVLNKLKGVSGTSAGAITALMLSLGMNTKEIEKQITDKEEVDFDSFFDPPQPRRIPKPSPDYLPREDDDLEQALLAASLDPKTLTDWLNEMEGNPLVEQFFPDDLKDALKALLAAKADLASWLSGLKPPASTLLANLGPYLVYLRRDMGFFSGHAARQYFDKLISERAVKKHGGKASQYINMSFERHKELFKRELLVCGANFSTGKTELFSARQEHTPGFPVADAVRISMSLPIAYKPYVITHQRAGWPPCGTYIDGGYWNNLPLREINPHADSGATPAGQVLALRLGVDEPHPVETFGDVVMEMIKGIGGSGESQVLREFKHLTVSLDTRDLELLVFTPEEDIRIRVTKRSRRQMRRYFGGPNVEIPKGDQDAEDDRKTDELSTLTVCKPTLQRRLLHHSPLQRTFRP